MNHRPSFVVFDEITPALPRQADVERDKAFLDDLVVRTRSPSVADARVWMSYREMNRLRRMAGRPLDAIKRKNRRVLIATVLLLVDAAMDKVAADFGALVAHKLRV
jgi:hypothetical protein